MPVRVVCCCDEGELIDAESTRAEKSLGRKGVLKERAMTQLSQLAAALLVAALIFLLNNWTCPCFFLFLFLFLFSCDGAAARRAHCQRRARAGHIRRCSAAITNKNQGAQASTALSGRGALGPARILVFPLFFFAKDLPPCARQQKRHLGAG